MVDTGWLVLGNDAAGSADDDALAAVAAELEDAEVVTTSTPDEVDDVLRRLDGRVLVVAGGDGSISVAVASARRLGMLDEVVFGLVPLGTGNDLAGHHRIADDPAEAARALRSATPQAHDLVVADTGQVCVNALHIGVGVDAAERASDLKDGLGALAYPIGAMIAGAAAEGLDLTVTVDGEPVGSGEPVLMVIVGNGTTIGGGAPAAPDADPHDGLLDVVVSHAVGPAARVAYGAALARGTHTGRDDVVTARGSEVVVAGRPLVANVDGDLDDEPREPHTWRVEPAAWQLLEPDAG